MCNRTLARRRYAFTHSVEISAYNFEMLDSNVSTGTVSTIALWGRSMGAATALMHGERDPSIAGMVLDSAFADLT